MSVHGLSYVTSKFFYAERETFLSRLEWLPVYTLIYNEEINIENYSLHMKIKGIMWQYCDFLMHLIKLYASPTQVCMRVSKNVYITIDEIM